MLTLQLFLAGNWHDAALLELNDPPQGRHSQARLAYNFTYAIDYLERNDIAGCSVNYPVSLLRENDEK